MPWKKIIRGALEEKENALQSELQALKRKREAHELKTHLAATSTRLTVLSYAEEGQHENLQGEGKDGMNAYLDEMSIKSFAEESEFLSLDKITKAFSMMQTLSVRPRDGVHFQTIPERDGSGVRRTSRVQASSPLGSLRKSSPPKATSKASDQSLTAF
jgi:hypothetical protein